MSEVESIIDNKCNVKYNEESGLIENEIIDYKIDIENIKDYPISFYKKTDIKHGISGHYMFQIDNFCYIFGGGSSGSNGGCHLFKIKNKIEPKFNNNLLRYDLEKNIWKDLGEISEISKRSDGTYFVYNKKMYILGGFAFEYTDKKFLDEYLLKYGKLPEKKGQWYSNDMWEIYVDENDNIFTKRIELDIFTNYGMKCCVIDNIVYIIGGMFGKYQLNTMSTEILSSYLKMDEYKEKIKILGDTYISGQILFFIDMKKLNKGLQVASIFPGVPCVSYQIINYNNFIYIFSQNTFKNNSYSNMRPGERNSILCNDNWKYNILNKEWHRIVNTPIKGLYGHVVVRINTDFAIIMGGSRAFMTTSISNSDETYKDYYEKFINTNDEIIEFEEYDGIYNVKESILKPYFKYGTISNNYSYFNENDQKSVISLETIKSYDYFQHYFSDIIMFYNFKEDKFYLSNHHLPYNVSIFNICPIKDNSLFIIGGEINDILFNSKFHYINTNLCIELKCNEINLNF